MTYNIYNVLSVAIRKNDYELAKKILKRPGTILKSDNWLDYILLIKALQRGRKQIVKLLLENDCRVNKEITTNFFHTPLYYAVKFGDLELVSLLLSKGALINGRDRNQETALVLAMRKKKLDIVALMLSQYFLQNTHIYDINASQHYTAYYIACLTDNVTAMNNFIRRGICVKNLQSNHSWYKNELILHFAVDHELIKLVDLLLKCGVSIIKKNKEGFTPLHLAFRNYMQHNLHRCSGEKIIDLILLAHNDKTENSIDNEGISHFHIACTRNDPEVVKKFINSGVDINATISPNSKILAGFTPLHCAAYFKCTSVVLLLLQHRADINALNAEGCTPLHVSIRAYAESNSLLTVYLNYSNFLTNRSEKIMDYILSAHNESSLNSFSPTGVSHFHIACTRFNIEVVKGFLNRGVDINSAISVNSIILSGYTPLHCAVKFKNVDVVRLLLEHEADINVVDAQGLTALHMAFTNSAKFFEREKSDAIVDAILLAHTQKSINSVTKYGLSHLHIACTRNFPEIVENFLKQGVNVNEAVNLDSKILSGCTPLHCAVKYNRAAVVKLLLQYKANVDAIDARKLKPLQVACQLSYNKMYELIKDEIRVYQKNEQLSWRQPQVHPYGQCNFSDNWVSNRNDQLVMINLLLKYETDANVRSQINMQPLLFESYKEFKYTKIEEVIHSFVNRFTKNHVIDIALKEFLIRRKDMLKIFLNYKFDTNSCDNRGYTMLHILASNFYEDDGVIETAELLLKNGANINAVTNSGMTPLHIAIKNGYRRRDLVEIFLENDAEVNHAESEKNLTPLHLACSYYCEDPVQYQLIMRSLIAKGADVNARDINGMTPLYTACNTNSQTVTEILRHGADINVQDNRGKTVLHHILEVERSSYAVSGYDLFCVIRNHIKKLKVIGMYVSKRIETFCSDLERKYQSIYYNNNNEFTTKCLEEFKKIKSIKVDNYSSLYDVILKDSNKMANYVKNEAFTNILNSEKFDKDFREYGYLLRLQYLKGLERESLLEPSKEILSVLIRVNLPDSCSEHILQYFSNQELREFLKNESFFVPKG